MYYLFILCVSLYMLYTVPHTLFTSLCFSPSSFCLPDFTWLLLLHPPSLLPLFSQSVAFGDFSSDEVKNLLSDNESAVMVGCMWAWSGSGL